VLFGPRPDLVGWEVVGRGHPEPAVLDKVSHFDPGGLPYFPI
jgi:hypothetical protein